MIKPLAREIQNLKYEVNYVYFDEREGVYCLVQENIILSFFIYFQSQRARVLRFETLLVNFAKFVFT